MFEEICLFQIKLTALGIEHPAENSVNSDCCQEVQSILTGFYTGR